MQAITLFELNTQIKQQLKQGFPTPLWVTAEITEIQQNSSGHCYLQLADKKQENETITAIARATIWAFTYRTLCPYFETTTGRLLAKGIKIMIKVEIVFHEQYGYSLNIKDIDPTYTIGDLERRKQEILLQLEKEGIIDMNRTLEFPLLPQRIAIITSPTAAGYGDFINQLQSNPYQYRYHTKLFPATMQGEKTAQSIIDALDKIYQYEQHFDIVVIIRGGGSQTDLAAFDSYELVANIAQFPLPIITGIGHERDQTISDRVAHLPMKTPTAVATHLVEAYHQQEQNIQQLQNTFITGIQQTLHNQQQELLIAITQLNSYTQSLLTTNTTQIKLLSKTIHHNTKNYIQYQTTQFTQHKACIKNCIAILLDRRRNNLLTNTAQTREKARRILADHNRRQQLATTTTNLVDPQKILQRGYSITRINGKVITNIDKLTAGDTIQTQMANGQITSQIINIKQS